MLISSVNISQGWTLSECAIIPHRGGDEIAREAKADVGKSERDWVEMRRAKGTQLLCAQQPWEQPDWRQRESSDRTGAGEEDCSWRGKRGLRGPFPHMSQGCPVWEPFKGGVQSSWVTLGKLLALSESLFPPFL